MRRPLVIAIHGVNHSRAARAAYPLEWSKLLLEQGFDVDVVGAPWSSLDSFLLDGAASLADDRVMHGHIKELMLGIEGAPGIASATVHRALREGRRIVMIAHSWGCVLGYAIKESHGGLGRIPMVGIGSPHTHQAIGWALRRRGRVPPWPSDHGPPPVFISNRDDKICSWSRWLPTLPPPRGTKLVWAKHEGRRMGATQEHEPWQYFATDAFRRAFAEALRS